MAYSASRGGDGWEMVPCLMTFLIEVEQCVAAGLLDVTNLGQLGDRTHQAEPTSRHNPARAPNGKWYVCAADFGGRDYARLAEFHAAMYRAHDPRLFRNGLTQRGDGQGLSWPDGGWHWTGSDFGHCHFDVNMASGSLNSNWWVDALASTAPWGLANWLRTGSTTAPTQEDDMTPDEMFTVLQQGRTKDLITGYVHEAFTEPHALLELAQAVARELAKLQPKA